MEEREMIFPFLYFLLKAEKKTSKILSTKGMSLNI